MNICMKGLFFVALLFALVWIQVERRTTIPHAGVFNFTWRSFPLPKTNDALKPEKAAFSGLARLMAPEAFAPTFDDRFLFMSLMTGAVAAMDLSNNKTWLVSRLGLQDASCDDYSYEREPVCGRPLGLAFDFDGRKKCVCVFFFFLFLLFFFFQRQPAGR
jgi:hypothetical protein